MNINPPCGRRVEYAHRLPACRMRRLKGCPYGSASTTWDYTGLLCNNRHKTLPPFSNVLCPIPTQPLLHMMQHVADWVAPFPRRQHSPPPPLKFFHTALHLPPCVHES